MAEYNMENAIEKAAKFLEEHHNTVSLGSADLKNGIWHIVFDVGFLSVQLKEVKIDAKTGKILGYTDIDFEDDND